MTTFMQNRWSVYLADDFVTILKDFSYKTYMGKHYFQDMHKHTLIQLGPTEYVLPEDGDRIQSPKRRVLKNKYYGVFRYKLMSRNIIFVLMYHRHKLLYLIYIL
jgi:hypothetical protein